MLQNDPELFELSMSKKTQPLMDLVKKHCEENVKPIQAEYSALQNEKEDRWSWHPRQIELMEGAKEKAKELGLTPKLYFRGFNNSGRLLKKCIEIRSSPKSWTK